MAIDLSYNTGYLNFGSPALLDNLNPLSIYAVVKCPSGAFYQEIAGKDDLYAWPSAWNLYGWFDAGHEQIRFARRNSASLPSEPNSVWYVSAAGLTNTVLHLYFYYDKSSSANTPVFYVNGTSRSVTTYSRATVNWSPDSDASYDFTLGDNGLITIYSFSLYNRALTAGEISRGYDSRLRVPTRNGLILSPNLMGTGTVTGVRDNANGINATIQGSPVYGADSNLNYGGI